MRAETKAEQQRICEDCVGEPFLKALIVREGRRHICFYCAKKRKTFSLSKIADAVEAALEDHYDVTLENPTKIESFWMKESGSPWSREGDPVALVIQDCAQLEEEPAEDIRRVLESRHSDFELAKMGEENPFDANAYYAKKWIDDAETESVWLAFEDNLKTEGRYFNRAAETMLISTFEGIAEQRDQDGRPALVKAGPGTKLPAFYRARVFQSQEKLESGLRRPDEQIGPPPPAAAPGGRMNAHGISVFYGAVEPDVALAEVRPPVGSTVVVARFSDLSNYSTLKR